MTTAQPLPASAEKADLGLVGRRCVQFALDRLIVLVPMLVLSYLAARILIPYLGMTAVVWIVFALFVLMMAGMWLFETWWPLRHDGQTPAMRWLGLRIVTLTGEKPTMRAYVSRALLMVVDGFLWGLLGLAVMLLSERRQRVGDMLTGTLVVRD